MQFHLNENYGIGRYRLSISSDEWIDRPDASEIAKLLSVPAKSSSGEQQARIDKAFLQSDSVLRSIDSQLQAVTKRSKRCSDRFPRPW